MPSEPEWVASWVGQLEDDLQSELGDDPLVRVVDKKGLAYAFEIEKYCGDEPGLTIASKYETDVLILDESGGRQWTPRVVIEAKLKSITTHDALTYSTKAATHKQVHPYIRYGVLIGDYGNRPVPARLFRHGAYFDFMMRWESLSAMSSEWDSLVSLIVEEIKASRTTQALLTDTRKRNRPNISLIHRPLKIKI